MGAVESVPTVSHSERIFFATNNNTKRDSPSITQSPDLIISNSNNNIGTKMGEGLVKGSVCLSSDYGGQATGHCKMVSDKPHGLKKTTAKSLLRASIRRYDQMAAGWSRNNNARVRNTPGSPKRMPSAEDIGAITRAAERRRLESGEYLAVSGSGNNVFCENQGSFGISPHFSASMPHLPSRLNGSCCDSVVAQSKASSVATPSDNNKRPLAESIDGISGLVDVVPGSSSAASSLLMFPIDFTSAASASTTVSKSIFGASTGSSSSSSSGLLAAEQSPKETTLSGVVRKTRSSSISEIRQRLTRRLSRNNSSSNNSGRRRSGSNNSSPTTSPTSRSKQIGNDVKQSKRLFTGKALIAEEICSFGKTEDNCLAADELVRGLESLSIGGKMDNDDDNVFQDQRQQQTTSRLLSESIDLVLEKRLHSTGADCNATSVDNDDGDDDISDGKCSGYEERENIDAENRAANDHLSTDAPLLSESLSTLTLSDGGCFKGDTKLEQQSTGRTVDVVDYEDYVYLSTHEITQQDTSNHRSDQPNGFANDDTAHPLSVNSGFIDGGSRRWWPRRVLPVHNMQYMPKLSKLFTELNQLNNVVDTRDLYRTTDYVCSECMARTQPVDEAMMADFASGLHRECHDTKCRNHSIGICRSSSSMTTLGGWISSNSFSGVTLTDKGNISSKMDCYWDVLSRCPMRPTSSLALASLKAMAKSTMSSKNVDKRRGFNNGMGAPLSNRRNSSNRRNGYSTDSSGSESSDGDTEYSDEENVVRNKDESILHGFLSSSGSATSLGHSRQRNKSTTSSSSSSSSSNSQSQGQGQRGKQKQKRVLSEPMQYILYNSYLRYYGRQGES
ncbi:hypothetical protein H4R99_000583 [Coemansia sp. RSA 1722]|nr:hypothetical protein IWW45_000395 [Coemansia sp. RSA 485]KAJ2603585.1 hypothetical protein GGF39_000078 [Coemansia sp. RSA 1721]KAJ2606188.1 hypothetical protein H4R99_000583 [Coemansia sp. RSA 1722]KAJ2639689.1 hypothetical protein GGF40_000655 [Coemansia sp. RSA 1286]